MDVLHPGPACPALTGDLPGGPGSVLTLLVGVPGCMILGDQGLTSAVASGATEAACPVQLASSLRRRALTPGQRLILALAFSEGNCTLHLPLVHTF